MEYLWEELCNLITAERKQYDIRNNTENRHEINDFIPNSYPWNLEWSRPLVEIVDLAFVRE